MSQSIDCRPREVNVYKAFLMDQKRRCEHAAYILFLWRCHLAITFGFADMSSDYGGRHWQWSGRWLHAIYVTFGWVRRGV